MKKAELSISMIVLVVIALLVLVLIAYMLFQTSSNYNTSTACHQRGGVCVASGGCQSNAVITGGRELCPDSQQPTCCRIGGGVGGTN